MNDCIHVGSLATLNTEVYPVALSKDFREYAQRKKIVKVVLNFGDCPMTPVTVDEAARWMDGEDMIPVWRNRLIEDLKRIAKN